MIITIFMWTIWPKKMQKMTFFSIPSNIEPVSVSFECIFASRQTYDHLDYSSREKKEGKKTNSWQRAIWILIEIISKIIINSDSLLCKKKVDQSNSNELCKRMRVFIRFARTIWSNKRHTLKVSDVTRGRDRRRRQTVLFLDSEMRVYAKHSKLVLIQTWQNGVRFHPVFFFFFFGSHSWNLHNWRKIKTKKRKRRKIDR